MTRDVLVAGETLVDFIPERAGPLADVETFTRRAGGAPANVAVALARLDRPPWFCTSLATDPFGDFLAGVLDREGVPDRFRTREDDRKTALAFVAHDADADREFTFYRTDTADVHLDTGVVPDETLAPVRYVVVGGVTLTVEPARSATFDLVERAREHGCRVVFDPNTRPELWDGDPTPTLDRMLRLVDVLKATPEDFAPTGVETGDDLAATLLERGPNAVFVTEGEAGARAVAADDSPWGRGAWHHDGYDVAEVVDATGAGDAFTAGVVAALADGAGPEETLAFANAVAAAATTRRGAMAALPDRDAVERVRDDSTSGPR